MMSVRPFHIAVPVHDLDAARGFYGGLLQCAEGRSSDSWVDFNLYGHQFVCHCSDAKLVPSATNTVEGHNVPVPHYGVVLDFDQWEALAERLRAAGANFIIEPTVRFYGEPGEQATLFVLDPSGNALEFKAFRDDEQLFDR